MARMGRYWCKGHILGLNRVIVGPRPSRFSRRNVGKKRYCGVVLAKSKPSGQDMKHPASNISNIVGVSPHCSEAPSFKYC